MEVHAHSHTPRKKWTHYLWEFIMLFLAVFLGFLAENQREHYIEHQREKKYMYSLATDLKGDTAEINSTITFNIRKFHGMDSLTLLLTKESLTPEDEQTLYFLNGQYGSSISTVIFNDRTIRQLLNSGNLRLVREQSTSDSIMNYYGQSKDAIIGQEKVYEEISKRLLITAEDIFDRSPILLQMNLDGTFYRNKQPEKMKLITKEKKVLKKYSQMIQSSKELLAVYIDLLFNMRIRANNLLSFLEKEYHLK